MSYYHPSLITNLDPVFNSLTVNGVSIFNGDVILPMNAPASPVSGSVYLNVSGNQLYLYNGSGFIPSRMRTQYHAIVQVENGSAITARRFDGTLLQSGAIGNNDASIINTAISEANNKGALFIAPFGFTMSGNPGAYIARSSINSANMNLKVYGVYNTGGGAARGRNGDTIIRSQFSGSLINNVNTVFSKQLFEDLVIEGDFSGGIFEDVGIGIDTYDVREREFMRNVSVVHFGVGVRIPYAVETEIYNPVIAFCSEQGLYLTTSGSSAFVNTMRIFGGRIINNFENIRCERVNDLHVYGTALEAGLSRAIVSTSGSNCMWFDGCSVELNTSGGSIVIDEFGNNNTYSNFRFDSSGSYTAIVFNAGSRHCKLEKSTFQGNISGITATINIASGAVGTRLFDNSPHTNTPTNIQVNNSGQQSIFIGNNGLTGALDQLQSGIILGPGGVRLIEATAGALVQVTDQAGTARRNILVNAIHTDVIRSIGSVDTLNISGGGVGAIVPFITRAGLLISGQVVIGSGAGIGISGNLSPVASFTSGLINLSGFNWAGTISTTVGAAGPASAPPATPTTYLTINVSGSLLKIPAYNV